MKITSIQQQVKQTTRYSIYVDGTYSFSLSETALLDSGIASGQELTAADVQKFKQLSADDKAYGRALRYVAIRLRSEWELRTYLQRKEVPEPTANTIIDRLRRLDLVNDKVFARNWVANRRLLKPTSRKRLQAELRQKHVPADIIDIVLHDDRGQTDERQILRDLADRKRSRYPDTQKLMAYLARQGYSYDDIKSVLEELGAA